MGHVNWVTSIRRPCLFILRCCHTEGSDAVADAFVSLPTLPRLDAKRAEGYTQNKFTPYPGGSEVKNPPAKQEMWVWSLGQEDPQKGKWQPTPIFLPGKSHGQRSLVGYSQSTVSQRVGHDLETETPPVLYFSLYITFLELIYLVTRILCLLTPFIQFSLPHFSPLVNYRSNLFPMSLFVFEVIIDLQHY